MSKGNEDIKILPSMDKLYIGKMSYLNNWEKISKDLEIKDFRYLAVDGELTKTYFRSVIWRVLLKILPSDSKEWLTVIRNNRESYETTRLHLMVTPGIADHSIDPNLNNPLSQDEKSLWNQYFEDSELKRVIRMDVTRTFPEVEFFQSPRIQEMMVSILFCYARKYSQMCYIQGMHEILAPLAFAINFDYQVHGHCIEDCTTKNLLQELMDQAYLEHDSFILFEAVMNKLSSWYEDGGPKMNLSPRTKLMSTQPFARIQDIEPTNKIVNKLTKIHEELLKQFEPEVYAHLNCLEIAPQLYGIRWARLMFGREFAFRDVLLIWDAIFADPSSEFILIEYLIVALLSNIKEKLLSSDYVDSMKYLMKYPPTPNVQSIISIALHFRYPQAYPYPALLASKSYTSQQEHAAVQEEPYVNCSESHNIVTRSASLPRHHAMNSTLFKHRSVSVEQKFRSGSEGARRKSSPSIEAMDPLNVVTFRMSRDSPETEDLPLYNSQKHTSETATTRVVSGLARLGERLGRPREQTTANEHSHSTMDRPMDELKYIEKSAPIPTPNKDLDCESSNSASSNEETDSSFPQKKIIGSLPKLSLESVRSASLSCAVRLSHYQANLATRLAQLNIENDLTIRSAMDGISEVVESLKEFKESPRRSPVKKKVINYGHACSLPLEPSAIIHPLMGQDNDL